MRTNYITQLTDNTRCRILNDTTTYMASHFFKTECGVITPNEDFTLVDEIDFKVNSLERHDGGLYVYEGDKALSDTLFVAISLDGSYKMFYLSDYSLVIRELSVKSKLRNMIVQVNELELNNCNKDGLFVLDSSHGLLANKTKEEVLEFFESYGRVTKEIIIKRNNNIEKLVIKETDYYVMVDNVVFNKKFKAANYENMYPAVNTYEITTKTNIGVLIEDMSDVKISTDGRVVVKNDKAICLKEKLKEETNKFEGYVYRVKEGLTFEDDIREVIEKECFKNVVQGRKLLSLNEYFINLIKEDIFHIFNM